MRKAPAHSPGRPRRAEVDAAILDAALDLLIEHGVEATTIEQVAKRAGVTRPTVYRRFPDKNQMLVAAIHMAHVGQQTLPPQMPECRDVEHMLSLWAQALCEPRRRRLMRRLMSSLDDHPDLREAYWNASIKHRNEWIRTILEQTRDHGDFPPDVNLEIIQQILTGAVAAHLTTYPDTSAAAEIEAYLLAVLRQTCYRRSQV
jgi:AcrR family transcriptional regulator